MRYFSGILLLILMQTSYAAGWTDLQANVANSNQTINGFNVDTRGNVYLATATSVLEYTNNQWINTNFNHPATANIMALVPDSCGDMNALTYESAGYHTIWQFNSLLNTWSDTLLSTPSAPKFIRGSTFALGVVNDNQGDLFASVVNVGQQTQTILANHCGSTTWFDTNEKPTHDNSFYQNNKIVATNQGKLYTIIDTGISNSALWQYDFQNKQWSQVQTTNSLFDIVADEQGNLYDGSVTGPSGGAPALTLWRYDVIPKNWQNLNTTSFPDLKNAYSFQLITLNFRGQLYASMFEGNIDTPGNFHFWIYNPITKSVNTINTGLAEGVVGQKLLAIDDQGNAYVMAYDTAGNSSIWKYDISQAQWVNTNAPNKITNSFKVIAKDNQGNFYVQTKTNGVDDIWRYNTN